MQELMVLGGLLVLVSAVLAALGYRGREQVVGIDLGTTFSVVAIKRKDGVTIIPDHLSGKLLVPSVVTVFSNGSTAVGDAAAALRSQYPLQTVFNAKRFIGRPMSDVAEDAAAHPFRVAANFTGSERVLTDANLSAAAGFAIPTGGSLERWVSPIDIGAEVVSHLKRAVAEFLGYEISRAVICVPAKFSWKETKATQEAFEQAGMKVMRVLEEPTAAAVAYNLHKATQVKHVLVYDIGGGTLDTSLLYMNGRSISVLGVAGDDHLGGSDFDNRMLALLRRRLPDAGEEEAPRRDGAELPERCDQAGLHVLAERAKIELSDAESARVRCLGERGEVRQMAVTRAEFEEAAADLFERSMRPVEKVLEDQMMTAEHIDDVVLVGGASRTPRLRALLQAFVGPKKTLHTEIDPDITVAYGAANILD